MYAPPRGNITTVLDFVDRDIQDDTIFPYTSDTSWFAPDGGNRSVLFTPMLQTFPWRGDTGGGRQIVVDLDGRAGDYLHAIFLQIELDDGEDSVADGVSLIENARLVIGETVIEELDATFSLIALRAFSDANMFVGLSDILRVTDDRRVTCILPFWFSRIPYKESLPLVACEDGTVRLYVTFREGSCGSAEGGADRFKSLQVLTYGSILSGAMRDVLQEKAFEILYRPVQRFVVDNPLRYAVTKSNKYVDANDLTVALPFNGPIEELLWVVRRKGAGLLNFSGAVAGIDPVIAGRIVINGSVVVEDTGHWFRAHIAGAHRGGIEMYGSYIYGYSFAGAPGDHAPSGSVNFSRANSVELRLTVGAAGDGDNWEVYIYGVGLNWLRFENGMCGRIFSS